MSQANRTMTEPTPSEEAISRRIREEDSRIILGGVDLIMRIQHRYATWKFLRGATWTPNCVMFPVGDSPELYTVMQALPFLNWETNTEVAVAEAKEFIEFNRQHVEKQEEFWG